MSLILDALRKSEAERRRGELPALALELPPAHTRTLPARLLWLAAPLALVAAVATWWIVQRDAPPLSVAVEPSVAATPVVEADLQRPRRTLPAAPPWEPPRRRTVREELAAVAAPTATASAPAPAPAPAPAAEPEPVSLADLTPDERRALPPLELSMHLWSEDPARRFVILDGRRLAEGDRAGPAVVARIDPDGVILAADGRRIRVPLP